MPAAWQAPACTPDPTGPRSAVRERTLSATRQPEDASGVSVPCQCLAWGPGPLRKPASPLSGRRWTHTAREVPAPRESG